MENDAAFCVQEDLKVVAMSFRRETVEGIIRVVGEWR